MSKWIKKKELNEFLKHATGEIVLTVVGIIIGLQVHVWTEERSNRREVETIVGNLYDEFIQNRDNLIETTKQVETSLNNAKKVIGLIGKSKAELSQYNLDSLLAVSFRYKKFNPSEDVISVLVESGKLKLIEDDSMRNSIYNWSSNEITLNSRFIGLANNTAKIFEYLTENYSLKDLDYYSSRHVVGKSNLKIDKYKIFGDIVFENRLDDEIFHLHYYIQILKETEGIINEIIENSKKYQ